MNIYRYLAEGKITGEHLEEIQNHIDSFDSLKEENEKLKSGDYFSIDVDFEKHYSFYSDSTSSPLSNRVTFLSGILPKDKIFKELNREFTEQLNRRRKLSKDAIRKLESINIETVHTLSKRIEELKNRNLWQRIINK